MNKLTGIAMESLGAEGVDKLLSSDDYVKLNRLAGIELTKVVSEQIGDVVATLNSVTVTEDEVMEPDDLLDDEELDAEAYHEQIAEAQEYQEEMLKDRLIEVPESKDSEEIQFISVTLI